MSNKHLTIILLSFGILGAYFVKKERILRESPAPEISAPAPIEKPEDTKPSVPAQPEAPKPEAPKPEAPAVPEKPNNPINLKITIPGFLEYQKTKEQAKEWQKEAPELVTVDNYGKSTQNRDLFYIKIANKKKEKNNPNIFITAAIHGNESWSSTCAMAYAGTLISEYGKNNRITNIIDSKNIYVIPIVSPDSYPRSRTVDRVDPNRNFFSNRDKNFLSVSPVQNLKAFYQKIQPKSVISMHTYGRIFLFPYGETYQDCENKKDYVSLVGKMAEAANYKIDKACNLYTRPINGTDVDYYHKNGSFSIVMEVGTHQVPPTMEQTVSEFQRTWEAILLFLEESTNFDIIEERSIVRFLDNTSTSDTYFQAPLNRGGLKRILLRRR